MDKDDAIELLLDLLVEARKYVASCADEEGENPAKFLLDKINEVLEQIEVANK